MTFSGIGLMGFLLGMAQAKGEFSRKSHGRWERRKPVGLWTLNPVYDKQGIPPNTRHHEGCPSSMGDEIMFDRWKIAEGWYLALCHCHGGQHSPEYARLSRMLVWFTPSPLLSVERLDADTRAIYDGACESMGAIAFSREWDASGGWGGPCQ